MTAEALLRSALKLETTNFKLIARMGSDMAKHILEGYPAESLILPLHSDKPQSQLFALIAASHSGPESCSMKDEFIPFLAHPEAVFRRYALACVENCFEPTDAEIADKLIELSSDSDPAVTRIARHMRGLTA